MFSRIGSVNEVNANAAAARSKLAEIAGEGVRMPTIGRAGPYRLFFYSADGAEPPHVHIERDDRIAKYWLSPVRLALRGGLSARDLRDIERILVEREVVLLEAWHEYFDA